MRGGDGDDEQQHWGGGEAPGADERDPLGEDIMDVRASPGLDDAAAAGAGRLLTASASVHAMTDADLSMP